MSKPEKRDTFIVRKKYRNQIQKLTWNQRRELLDCIFLYQIEWKFDCKDDVVHILMDIMVDEREADNEKYDEKCEKNKLIALQREKKKKENNTNVNERGQTWTNDTYMINDNDKWFIKENVKRKFLDYVYLSDEEYKKISDRYWESVLKDFIERLDNRIWEKPNAKNRQDRDHYRTILQRIKKEGIKERSTKKQLSEFEIEEWVYDLEKLNAFSSYPT